MMRDAFGDALQKIASAAHKPSSPAHVSSPPDAAPDASISESMASTRPLVSPPAIMVIEERGATNDASRVHSTVCEVLKPTINVATVEHPAETISAGSSGLSETPTQDPRPADESRSPLTFLLDHRRQTAAVVVLICIAVIWSDDGTSQTALKSSDGQTQSQSSAETDSESLLSEFDAIHIRPLREPAVPVEPSAADPFPFSMPADEAEASIKVDSPAANVSHATNQIPPAQSPATVRDSGPEQSPISPVSSSASHSVRFTGQIEPLK